MLEQSPILRWRTYNEKYLLEGTKCKKCNKLFYPKKYLCICHSQKFENIILKGIGTLITFTQINVPSKTFSDQTPFCIGIVQLDEGPKILTQITDSNLSELKIGMKVQASFRKIGTCKENEPINYGLKFIPIE